MSVGVDPSLVDNETGWLSSIMAKRALRAIPDQLGTDALKKRGDWMTHPEALGTLVRMLRVADRPVDAYRYLAANAREQTRIGTWEIEEAKSVEPHDDKADKGDAKDDKPKGGAKKKKPPRC